MADNQTGTALKSTKEIEDSPAGVVRRWVAELDLASTTEEKWRKQADSAWDLYRSKDPRGHSFNILWSNTETMRPALYNSQPRPDVRRRFRDADPVGKVASSVLERSLTYSIDAYDFDQEIKLLILDSLLCGRGVSRVKYVPKIQDEEVTGEKAVCEQVQWKDFRNGPGKTWNEVRWIAFRHDFTYDECLKQFDKDIADALKYTERGKFSNDDKYNEDVKSLIKTTEVWEFWDKDSRKTHFISPSYDVKPCKTIEDSLKLEDFFPMPRPLYAIEDSESLIPQIPYEKYQNQAEELNDISFRLRKVVKALKVRGAYAAHLSEVAKIIDADDAEMIPVENSSLLAEIGGFEKAIYIMPIDKLVQVFEGLLNARSSVVQTIYEITGLGDIMRGVSNPHETLGAQQLKSQWGSLRLQRSQREVQRYIRDVLRLKAEVMAEHFDVKTFMSMTGVMLPTEEHKQQAAQIIQASQQPPPQAPPAQPGEPPTPAPAPPQIPPDTLDAAESALRLPTWDDVMGLLKSEYMRMYRIDIETDSTVQETLTKDVQGFSESITGIVQLFTGMGPAIQEGILSVEVVKQLALSAARLSRMGQAVEDALEQIKQPPPKPAEQAPPDFTLQIAQIKAQNASEIAQNKAQNDTALAQFQAQTQKELATMQSQIQLQIADSANKTKLEAVGITAQAQLQIAGLGAQTETTLADKEAGLKMTLAAHDAQVKHELADKEAQTQKDLANQDSATKLGLAEHSAQTQEKLAEKDAANQMVLAEHGTQAKSKEGDAKRAHEKEIKTAPEEHTKKLADALTSVTKTFQKVHDHMTAPKKIVLTRDAEGNISGGSAQ